MSDNLLSWKEMKELVYLKKANQKGYAESLLEMEDILLDVGRMTVNAMDKLRKEQMEKMKQEQEKQSPRINTANKSEPKTIF